MSGVIYNMVTFNVNSLRGNRLHRVAALIGKIKPDIVFLQEISVKSN